MFEHEITYRMVRLRAEADRARLAASGAHPVTTGRGGIRRLVGRALIGLGQLLEGPVPCPDERAGTARA